MVKVYFIAGEISGDFIGSHLIVSLKKLYRTGGENIDFLGVGGALMEEAGMAKSLFPIQQISLIGFAEILPHLFKITKLMTQVVEDIKHQKPDLLITIDSPGFTYRVVQKIRKLRPHLKILHIVAPSVWAYKPSRALKYAKIYDYLFALLPFEPPYFQKVGLNCRYIGHPIVEQNFYVGISKKQLREELPIYAIDLDIKILSVTCGSRRGEILRHMPIFVEAINLVARQYPNLLVIFVLADVAHQSLLTPFLESPAFNYHFSTNRLQVFAASDIALAKSGTNTLEIAACNTPMVVAYKLNILSYWLIKFLIKIKYISIINIVADRAILPELIQFNCTSPKIAAALISLLDNRAQIDKQLKESKKILVELGFNSMHSPSDIAATIIKTEYLSKI